jgi:hypothetical protein
VVKLLMLLVAALLPYMTAGEKAPRSLAEGSALHEELGTSDESI